MKTLTYPFEIGELQGVVLFDGANDHTVEGLIVNCSEEELVQISQEYDFTPDKIPVGYNNVLLMVGDQYVLVDAGIGRPLGELRSGLEELDVDPGDIDMIVITHSDRDHIGGILDEYGEIAFPKARYIMLEDAWQYWTSEEKRTELERLNKWQEGYTMFAWEIYLKIRDSILFTKPGETFMPGFQLFPAPGHRFDHSILKVSTSDIQFIHLSDAVVHPLFMEHRDWYSTYDANPPQAVDTKIKLLNECASERALVFGAHFPFPGLGYVHQGGGRWRWEPAV